MTRPLPTIHQITDGEVGRCPRLEEVLPFYMNTDQAAGVNMFVAHRWTDGRSLRGAATRSRHVAHRSWRS